jgi:hypothetical protein
MESTVLQCSVKILDVIVTGHGLVWHGKVLFFTTVKLFECHLSYHRQLAHFFRQFATVIVEKLGLSDK